MTVVHAVQKKSATKIKAMVHPSPLSCPSRNSRDSGSKGAAWAELPFWSAPLLLTMRAQESGTRLHEMIGRCRPEGEKGAGGLASLLTSRAADLLPTRSRPWATQRHHEAARSCMM